jgi:hypothetical protein
MDEGKATSKYRVEADRTKIVVQVDFRDKRALPSLASGIGLLVLAGVYLVVRSYFIAHHGLYLIGAACSFAGAVLLAFVYFRGFYHMRDITLSSKEKKVFVRDDFKFYTRSRQFAMSGIDGLSFDTHLLGTMGRYVSRHTISLFSKNQSYLLVDIVSMSAAEFKDIKTIYDLLLNYLLAEKGSLKKQLSTEEAKVLLSETQLLVEATTTSYFTKQLGTVAVIAIAGTLVAALLVTGFNIELAAISGLIVACISIPLVVFVVSRTLGYRVTRERLALDSTTRELYHQAVKRGSINAISFYPFASIKDVEVDQQASGRIGKQATNMLKLLLDDSTRVTILEPEREVIARRLIMLVKAYLEEKPISPIELDSGFLVED